MADRQLRCRKGPRFQVNDIQIIGNQYITEQSLRQHDSKTGDMFDGTLMKRDIGELVYGYEELGYIYADVEPKTVMRDESNVVDLVYEITEEIIGKSVKFWSTSRVNRT